ncbi:MAG: hypothetical protein R3Y33_07285, partial [Clostridia bacterium]
MDFSKILEKIKTLLGKGKDSAIRCKNYIVGQSTKRKIVAGSGSVLVIIGTVMAFTLIPYSSNVVQPTSSDESSLDESSLDESSLDESSLDESSLDESSLDESSLDESSVS